MAQQIISSIRNRANPRHRPYWYTFYVLEAFLLMQISYRHLLDGMSGTIFGYEEQLLNSIWMGLLGLEFAMVAGVLVMTLVRAIRPAAKQKTQ